MSAPSADTYAVLTDGFPLLERSLVLLHAKTPLRIRSNSDRLLDRLGRYFSHQLVADRDATATVIAIERDPPELGLVFADWRREAGKVGRKDAYADLPDGRVVQKLRTGMLFLQSVDHRVAVGPCLSNDNQVINFINAQWMNGFQQQGWQICHAAALEKDGAALAIAGLSGGGKSTLMLKLMEQADARYLTNDRLFVRHSDGRVLARGIPKLPRINPGTIVNNPRLHRLLPEARRHELEQLPVEQLWSLEEKHDVMIDEVYGNGRTVDEAQLTGFIVLNWRRDHVASVQIEPVQLRQRRDLLAAIMKSPGPFYQSADRRFCADDLPLDDQAYLAALEGVPVYEASGAIEFDRVVQLIGEQGIWSDA